MDSTALPHADPPSALPTQDVCSVVLHAPSEGLCRQYVKLVKSGLSVLALAASSSSTPDISLSSSAPPPTRAAGDAPSTPTAPPPLRLLSVVPGGATFDVSVAFRLDHALAVVRGQVTQPSSPDHDPSSPSRFDADAPCSTRCRSSSSHNLLARLILSHGPSALLPALLVLRSMSSKVPMVLAGTGILARGAEDDQSVRETPTAGQTRGAMLMVRPHV
jgi:hypothetical protein